MAKTEKLLEVKHLKQHFKSGRGKNKLVVKAVDDITFDIHRGEVFGLVGESGCGKTTTGRTIIKLYEATDGEIIFNGKRIGGGIESNIERIQA
ncbi:MAG: oligopeptide ABC transporter ATP-binding protein, partial [Tenericutes bacterium HGW-Tenericutes-3]